MQLATVGHI